MVRGKAACIFARPQKGRHDRVRTTLRKYRYVIYEDLEPGEEDEKKRTIQLVLKKGRFSVRVVLEMVLLSEYVFVEGKSSRVCRVVGDGKCCTG